MVDLHSGATMDVCCRTGGGDDVPMIEERCCTPAQIRIYEGLDFISERELNNAPLENQADADVLPNLAEAIGPFSVPLLPTPIVIDVDMEDELFGSP